MFNMLKQKKVDKTQIKAICNNKTVILVSQKAVQCCCNVNGALRTQYQVLM